MQVVQILAIALLQFLPNSLPQAQWEWGSPHSHWTISTAGLGLKWCQLMLNCFCISNQSISSNFRAVVEKMAWISEGDYGYLAEKPQQSATFTKLQLDGLDLHGRNWSLIWWQSTGIRGTHGLLHIKGISQILWSYDWN